MDTMAKEIGLDESRLQEFAAGIRGQLIRPGDEGYEQARSVYNAMIDRRPALIARCVDVADVMACVRFSRQNNLTLAVRGGGHSGPGLGTWDDALVIDLSPMKGIRVDPETRLALVQAGCTLGDLDHATHAFGLATPGGTVSTTGVAGLTLGGGMGHLTRKYGLTIDNLLAVDIVLADGSFVTANSEKNHDLFWAIRGGGGNFGVVTSFLFRLHPVGTVIGGPTFWHLDQAAEVIGWYRDFIVNAPEDLSGLFAFLTVPPVAPFPEHLHLKKVCGIVWCYVGPEEEAEKVFAPVRAVGPPALDGIGAIPYPVLQSIFDDLYPPGLQWYWRGDFVDELSDEAIKAHIEYAHQLPTMLSSMILFPIDGAAGRVGNSETAYSYRDATWSQVITGVDPDPANADLLKSWTVDYWEALHPYSSGGNYVNFLMEEDQDRIKATYRGNYARLVEIKRKYDPENVFHVNQNIAPKA